MYCSIEYIDSQIKKDFFVKDKWSNLNDEDKLSLAETVFDILEETTNWVGSKWDENQDKQFPRDLSSCYHYGNRYVKDNGIIPDAIIDGHIEYIKFFLKTDNLPNWVEFKDFGIKKLKIADTTEIEFHNAKKFTLPKKVWEKVKYYVIEYLPLRFERC